jgi:hypothetical protein
MILIFVVGREEASTKYSLRFSAPQIADQALFYGHLKV